MPIFNSIMNGLFDIFCFPFRGMPQLVGLSVFSAFAGIILLILYKYTSPQKTIGKIKDRIKADLLEIRLFKDDLGIVSGAIGRLFLKPIPFYLACNMVPLVPLIIVVLPMLVQLDSRYGFAPFKPGDRIVLEATLAKGLDPMAQDVRLELPKGLKCEVGPVRIPTLRELAYRLRVEKEGSYTLKIIVNGKDYVKRLEAAPTHRPMSAARYKVTRTSDVFFHPAARPWPANAALERIELKTPRRASMVGIRGDLYPWLWIFCIVGLVFGFALKGVFKVNI